MPTVVRSGATPDIKITLDKNVTVGSLVIGAKNNYTITGNTLKLDNTGSSNASINITGTGSPLIQSAIALNDNTYFTQNGTGTFTVSGKITTNGKSLITNGSGNTVLSGAITGNGGYTQAGTGKTTLSGTASNTFSNVTISNGTLALAKTSGINAIGGTGTTINVNSEGTLLLAGNNQIANTVNMILHEGTFSTGTTVGYSDTLGTLTLTGCSTIDLGTGSHDLIFANSSSVCWDGTLTIEGWVGVAGVKSKGGTAGSIFFGSNSSGLTSTQLSNIDFTGFGSGAMMLSTGEIVPLAAVPEAKVVFGVFLLVAVVGWRERDRFRNWISSLQVTAG
ncbi:MAG: hypothetical protein ABIP32_03225 [Chthoniobacterales bacterium]